MIENVGITHNISAQISDLSYNSIVNLINGKEVWIRYYTGRKEDSRSTVNGRESINDIPSIMVYIRKGKGIYQMCRYNGFLKYQRKVEEGLIIYTILNLSEIRNNIASYIRNALNS